VFGGCTKIFVTNDRTAIFPAAEAEKLMEVVCYRKPLGVTGYWTPEAKDIAGIEDTLAADLRSKEVREIKDWSKYRRQVVGLTRGEERLIFISFFPFDADIEEDMKARKTPGYDPESWKKKPYSVMDGGRAFFRVLYDLKNKRFIWYECNGDA
jgi:hypothetical protein